jgi:prepilin-type N-terminal cleavage/methylation domain-containing protein
MNVQRKEKGFTIIEVVLVLAIAGLIFLMVFIALPALQRSQRDTQRKNDLSRALTALTSYTSNNRGALPGNTDAAWQTFLAQYLTPANSTSTFVDPSGSAPSGQPGFSATPSYVFVGDQTGTTLGASYSSSTQNVIYYAEGFSCGSGGAFTAGSTRTVALAMYLEGGGVSCQNN